MKLLYVVHQFFPECHSGTEQYTLAAAREARRRGDEVTILSLEPHFGWRDPEVLIFDKPFDEFRVPRLRYWGGLEPNDVLRDYDNPRVGEAFDAFIAGHAPDAVHFFHLRYLGSNLLERAHARGLRCVVNLMDFWYLCPRFTLLKHDGSLCEGPPDGGLGCIPCADPELGARVSDAAVKAALAQRDAGAPRPHGDASDTALVQALLQRPATQLRRLALADAIVAPSRFLADLFVKNGLPRDRMTVVPYGLEPGRVRRVLGTTRPRTPLRVGFAGVLSPWKAPHLCVAAMRALPDRALQMTIHGRLEEGMFQDYIDAMRAAAAGDDRIVFAGAFGGDGALDQVMADLDLLVVPSQWYENTPFVVLEAFEAGVPVLASRLGGLSEVIVEGENGYLFEPGSAADLARVLAACLDEPARLRRLEPVPPGTIATNYDVFATLYTGPPDGEPAASDSSSPA